MTAASEVGNSIADILIDCAKILPVIFEKPAEMFMFDVSDMCTALCHSKDMFTALQHATKVVLALLDAMDHAEKEMGDSIQKLEDAKCYKVGQHAPCALETFADAQVKVLKDMKEHVNKGIEQIGTIVAELRF